jgi:polyphosphate kinase
MSDPAVESAATQPEDGRSASGSAVASLAESSLYLNRELSWVDFNDRVLQLAEDESLPLMERLKFLAIFVTNLDEFFMVRVAGVHDQLDARIDARGPDGLSPPQVLAGIADRVTELDRRHARQFSEVVRPELAEHGIQILSCEESEAPRELLERHFRE